MGIWRALLSLHFIKSTTTSCDEPFGSSLTLLLTSASVGIYYSYSDLAHGYAANREAANDASASNATLAPGKEDT